LGPRLILSIYSCVSPEHVPEVSAADATLSAKAARKRSDDEKSGQFTWLVLLDRCLAEYVKGRDGKPGGSNEFVIKHRFSEV